MPWFAAHVVLRIETTPPTAEVSVWENVYLVEADDHAAARAAGLQRGAGSLTSDDGFTSGGLPARWVVAGVRKTVECDDSDRSLETAPKSATPRFVSRTPLTSIDSSTRKRLS